MNFSDIAAQYGKEVVCSKKSFVFAQGDASEDIYLVKKGILKAFYTSENGDEYIKSFIFSGDTIASLQAINGERCSFSLLALQDTQLIKLPYSAVMSSATNNLEMANSVINLLMSFAMKKEQREYEFLCLSAEQRYQMLLQRQPDIYQFVKQKDIARYLGITPVALSRIKHQ